MYFLIQIFQVKRGGGAECADVYLHSLSPLRKTMEDHLPLEKESDTEQCYINVRLAATILETAHCLFFLAVVHH